VKKIVFFLLLSLVVDLASGQSVIAPDAKSYSLSTNGQDASGFSITGFNSTTTLLASIGLPSAPAGTTFYITTTTGITPASGFTLTGNKTRLVFTGTQANINNALASLKVNTGSTNGIIQLSVSATVNPSGYFYNPTNGHFYRPISTGTSYTNARAAALNTTFKGQQGYLVTITSADEDAFIFNNVPQNNIWFALTDEVTEGVWVIDAGPEKGTIIKTQNGQTAGNIVGQYNNWAPGEPNDSGGEDYAVTKWNGSQWNDLPNNFSNPYVIEYGTWSNPDDQTFTDFYSNSASHTVGEVFRVQLQLNTVTDIAKNKFLAKMYVEQNGQYVQTTSSPFKAFSLLGRLDVTTELDTQKINNNTAYKPHKVEFQNWNQTELITLYDQIVTVSDVYLAFKELANVGLLGNQSGLEFSSGIQFLNADVDGNGVFNSTDTYRLLQHLTGEQSLMDGTITLDSIMKVLSKQEYDNITKLNWNTFYNQTRSNYEPIQLSTEILNQTLNYNIFWKGDVNMSHSVQQTISAPTVLQNYNVQDQPQAIIFTELVNGKAIMDIEVYSDSKNLTGIQFKVNYDNTRLLFDRIESPTYQNVKTFGVDRNGYVNVGSLVYEGNSILDSKLNFKVIFTPKTELNNLLGLISIDNTDAVNREGKQVKVDVK
jgi:hypothetical protein